MKHLLLFTWALLLIIPAMANERKSLPYAVGNYSVISDSYSADVPAGQCVVTGKVLIPSYEPDGMVNYVPLAGCLVSTLDRKKSTYTDSTGAYRLVLDTKDTTLFMFRQEYEEIVVWNYPFQSRHIVTINFYPGIDFSMMEMDKPVIYLYSDHPVNAEIQFSCKGLLTFTYPEYKGLWQVEVTPDGLRDRSSGKQYPYLFWEARTKELSYRTNDRAMEGFLVRTDSVTSFLENSLGRLGLSVTEQTDFITYWAPRMIAQPYALVQFLVDDAYQANVAEIDVTPAPDAMRRVYMLYTPLQTDVVDLTLRPQQLTPFERSGFTLVEWGGSEIPVSDLIP